MNLKSPPSLSEDESLQRAIHEPLRLVPYDTAWPGQFEQERTRLHHLCPGAFRGIEHIGSTAVPTLSAKPIIDLMAGVTSLTQADAIIPTLCSSGYVTSAEFNATLIDKRWLMRHAEGRRTHHLHLMVFASPAWQKHLAFRDALRASADLRSRYAALKATLITQAGLDREAYTTMKTTFVEAALAPGE